MTSKTLKSSVASDDGDYSSVYTDDFETDSRASSPHISYNDASRRTNENKFVVSDESSYSSQHKSYTHKEVKKNYGSKRSAGRTGVKSTGLTKAGKKNPSPVKPDVIQARMLSAQRSRINTLNNEIGELQNKFEAMIKENKLLKKLQYRQEKSLRNFESKDGNIPRLITQYEDDQKVLKSKLRKCQESERFLESKLRDSSEEMQKMEHTVQRLKKLVDEKKLGERSELAKQLHTSQDRLYDSEKKNSELEKKFDLTTQSFGRQLNSEKAKHIETKEKLKILQEKYDYMENRLKDKERALQVSNIYALRAKPNVEKPPVNSKTNSSSLRKSAKKMENKSKPTSAKLPCQPLTQTTENPKPRSAGFINNVGTKQENAADRTSTQMLKSELTGSVDSLTDKTFKIYDKTTAKSNESGKDPLSFFNADKSPNSPAFDYDSTISPSPQDSGIARTPLLREKSFTIESKSNKKKEDEKKIEEEKKKAALLARMKNVDENDDSTSNLNDSDIRKLLGVSSLPNQKPVVHHMKAADNSSVFPSNKAQNNLTEVEDTKLTFGGYAPTVTSAPKRRLQSRVPTAERNNSDSEKPLLDINSGKSKNNDLMQQLFGNDGSTKSPLSNNAAKINSFNSSRRTSLPKATARVAPQQNEYNQGDAPRLQRKNDVIGSPLVKAITSSLDDDIEEMKL